MRFAQRTLAESPVLLARCEFSAGEDEAGRVPCLHSIGLMDVLRARQRGEATWLTMRGDCERCARGQREPLETRIAAINSALAERGLPAILLREVSAATWTRLLDAPPVETTAARRGFFGALGRRPVTALMQNTVAVPDDTIRAPGEWLPASQDGVLPWSIHLDAERCTGCHACARLCPQGAIEEDDSEAPAYRLRHARCTGCGLCSDVCQSNAVSPQSWCKAEIDEVPLQTHRCTACGVSFEMPAARGSASLCWVCSRALPARRLRHVMT